ncbi:MAG: Gfo/Idh/MocA family oxidoreductase [Blastochloris sp.]|nr:Gfo/Idh/MocA family oxidoreductase [Blastochloris sp.]
MKAALVGLGRMGMRHYDNLQSLGLDVVGVCDAVAEARESAQLKTGLSGDRVYSEPGRMMSEKKPECLVVATTAPAHAEMVSMAVTHGVRYILCEKPMAVSLVEAEKWWWSAEEQMSGWRLIIRCVLWSNTSNPSSCCSRRSLADFAA